MALAASWDRGFTPTFNRGSIELPRLSLASHTQPQLTCGALGQLLQNFIQGSRSFLVRARLSNLPTSWKSMGHQMKKC